MVEVQVREHHDVDVLVAEPRLMQRIEQDVAIFLHAVTLAQLRREEAADTGLEQHRLAVQRGCEQGATRQVDAIESIRGHPLLPHRTRRVAEHRTAIELLRIPED